MVFPDIRQSGFYIASSMKCQIPLSMPKHRIFKYDIPWGEKLSVNPTVHEWRGRILQDCTGKGFSASHNKLALCFISSGETRNPSPFPPPPFSRGGCFFEISVWRVEQKKKKCQESLILGGRKFVLTLKRENSVVRRSKQQTWDNSKCSLP